MSEITEYKSEIEKDLARIKRLEAHREEANAAWRKLYELAPKEAALFRDGIQIVLDDIDKQIKAVYAEMGITLQIMWNDAQATVK